MDFHMHRAKIKALNDSKEIVVIVYINSIALALLVVVEFALNTYHDVYAALFQTTLPPSLLHWLITVKHCMNTCMKKLAGRGK